MVAAVSPTVKTTDAAHENERAGGLQDIPLRNSGPSERHRPRDDAGHRQIEPMLGHELQDSRYQTRRSKKSESREQRETPMVFPERSPTTGRRE